jgi:hypothetical protein
VNDYRIAFFPGSDASISRMTGEFSIFELTLTFSGGGFFDISQKREFFLKETDVQ